MQAGKKYIFNSFNRMKEKKTGPLHLHDTRCEMYQKKRQKNMYYIVISYHRHCPYRRHRCYGILAAVQTNNKRF